MRNYYNRHAQGFRSAQRGTFGNFYASIVMLLSSIELPLRLYQGGREVLLWDHRLLVRFQRFFPHHSAL